MPDSGTQDQERMTALATAVRNDISSRVALEGDMVEPERIRELINQAVSEASASGLGFTDEEAETLAKKLDAEFLGFGPIQPLMDEPTISEIMVNGGGFDDDGHMLPHEIWIERDGKLSRVEGTFFDDDEHVVRIMNRIASRQGRHMDQANPSEDATLMDGSRFSGTIYPIDPDGSSFNIRKFQQNRLGYQDMIRLGTLTPGQMSFLAAAVMARCAILISGGTGSGKTTFLNMLAAWIPQDERIVTIEDTCELLIKQVHPNVTRLEARKANSEGVGEITMDDLLRNALRRRPDRIIVGECRGPEAYTMLEAMNTGHDGSLTTIHANDTVAALTRLTTLVKQGDDGLSEETIKAKIADALDLVVQVERMSDGTRRVVQIMSVGGYSDGTIQHDPIWEFERLGTDDSGKVLGYHRSCGVQPTAIKKKIEEAGIEYSLDWIKE